MSEVHSRLTRLFRDGLTDNKKYSAESIFRNKKLIVYGAGKGFIPFKSAILNRFGLAPQIILDDRFDKGGTFDGIAAKAVSNYRPSRDEITDSVVVVTVGRYDTYEAIRKDLRALGFENVIKSSDIFEFNLHHIPFELKNKGVDFYAHNRKNIVTSMQLMSDRLSQEIFYSMMKTYMTQVPQKIPHSPSCEQYFPTDIELNKGYSRFINCGSYDGDTIRQLCSRYGKIDALACFEPDEKNFTLLKQYVSNNKDKIAEDIVVFPCGVFSCESLLSFSGDKLLCSSVIDDGDGVIQCVALDDAIPTFRPTFISMDVEGVELEALVGAEQLIRDNKPDLAISVYHFPNHIWEIPIYLDNLDLGYRFYLRNYTGFTYETILYASVA